MRTRVSWGVAAGVALMAGLGWPGSAWAQTVTGLGINKNRVFEQYSLTNVVPVPASSGCSFCPFSFYAIVSGTNLASLPPPTLSGPIDSAALGAAWNGGRLVYVASDGYWHFGSAGDVGMTTQAALDARFGSGTYTVNVNGVNIALDLSGSFPNTPVLTLSGGAWRDGEYVIDARRALTITTNAFTAFGAGAGSVAYIETDRFGSSQHNPPGPNIFSRTIAPNTFTNGNTHRIWASFISISDNLFLPGFHAFAAHTTSTHLTLRAEAEPPPFPMVVTSNITPTVANATATFQPRPQDAGTTASVYVFAVAPSALVQNVAAVKRDGLSWKAQGAKADAPVQCVLAQLNASGQLQAVSASGLTAFVTGTLAASGQSVKILDNVATPNIAGTAFYVGYGTSAQQMIASGVNQRALDVAGSVSCDPRSPQTGWWFNPAEGGRGFSIEPKGNRLFMAAFHYEPDGRATWNFAGGSTSIDGSLFTADFMAASGGQTLTGAYRLPNLANAGTVTFAFSDAQHGTMVWPGGTTAIERQASVPNGLTLPPQPGIPESGWWWNPDESGRGFFMEWQGGFVNIAGYMYDEQGRPTWYITVIPTPDPLRITGNWWTFANGQAMGQPYREPARTSNNAGALDVQFTSATTATMRLPDGRTIPLVRQAF